MRSRVPLALVAVALTVLAARSIAGHDGLAGRTLIAFSAHHGVDSGDLPVLAVWLVGLVFLALLWRRD